MPKYNTMFDVAFSIDHDYEDPEEIPKPLLIQALERRIKVLQENPSDMAEAFGVCDTYENFDKIVTGDKPGGSNPYVTS